jgi:hypothetical protein
MNSITSVVHAIPVDVQKHHRDVVVKNVKIFGMWLLTAIHVDLGLLG